MSENTGPIYEVTHYIDAEIIDAFDGWLISHVDDMLEITGFVDASIFTGEDRDDGRKTRVTQYHLDSDSSLDRYFEGPAEVMRQSGTQVFGDRFEAQRRILHHSDGHNGKMRSVERCLNCNTILDGQYCGNCGQKARSRLISIWELVRDAFGDLFELDSRLWRTLIPLISKPGQLTRDYLEGRRVRFMPPFRTYLVLSIVFFVIAFFDPTEELGVLFGPEPDSTSESGPDSSEAAEFRDGFMDGITGADSEVAEPTAEEQGESGNDINVSLGGEEIDEKCEISDFEDADLPEFLASRLTPEEMAELCKRVVADDGKAFGTKLLDNVPAGLIFLLPLMALVLKVLYPLSNRYYVEHLLFIVHFHAFFFLILILQILFSRMTDALSLPGALSGITIFATSLYVPIYLYKSMRRVYAQGHLITIPKYLFLLASYVIGFSVMFVFAALLAVLAM